MTEKRQAERKLLLTGATLVGLGAGMMMGTNVKADSTNTVNTTQDQTTQSASLLKSNYPVSGVGEDSASGTGDEAASDGSSSAGTGSNTDTGDGQTDTSVTGDPNTATDDQSDFSFSQNGDGNYTVTGYTGAAQKAANGGVDPTYSTDVTIPDTYKDGYVTAIGNNAFNNEAGDNDNLSIVDGLTSVTFGKNIQQIGDYAFAGNKLTSISFPDSTWSIGKHAFENNQLSDLTLNKVTQIGDYAFSGNSLTKISFPDSTWSVGAYAFSNNQLSYIDLNHVTQVNDHAFIDNNLSKLVISDKTTNIADYAFEGNHITDLTLGSSLQTIGISAFQNNGVAGVITFPSSLIRVGDNAFADNAITGVVFDNEPSGTTTDKSSSIGTGAFQHNQIIGIVTLPDSLTELGDYAFADNKITGLNFNDKITKMNTGVFENNNLQGSLALPENIIYVGNSAFYNNEIDSLTLDKSLKTIGTSAFANNNLSDNVVIPNSVTSVGESSFENNELTGVDLTGSLDNLGNKAFNTNNLQTINIEQTIKAIGDEAFSNQETLPVSVYASVTQALDVKKSIAKQLGLSADHLAQLKFKLGDTDLNYDEANDKLTLPKDYQGKDTVMKLVLASDGPDTGWYGTKDLELTLNKKMVIADVTIPSNLNTDPVVPKVEGQVGAQVKVKVPNIAGYSVSPTSIYATVNDDGAITANRSVEYTANTGSHTDPDDGNSGTGSDTGTDSGTGTNPDTGSNTGTNTDPDSGSNTDTGSGTDTNKNSGTDSNSDSGSEITDSNTSTTAQSNSSISTNSADGKSNQSGKTISVNYDNVISKSVRYEPTDLTKNNNPVITSQLPQTSEKSNSLSWLGVIILGFLGLLGFNRRKN
ncbi:leucine-rich repeat protein [Companilactobacillus kedongensis]|uniref:leucine-rich repeat protein n=1 Tax=Companilactobacillus kedongensis TaxID=2486004 RepID=UPI000F767195|nr:leucine-rich repeat protein [Companilactobacillus kedongensis]